MATGEVVERVPVGDRGSAVEQARGGEDEGAGADRGDPRAPPVGTAQRLDCAARANTLRKTSL